MTSTNNSPAEASSAPNVGVPDGPICKIQGEIVMFPEPFGRLILAEKDPEAAARVQASIDAGVDPDKALANEGVDTSSGLMKGLKFGAKVTTAPLRLLGKAGGAVMEMFKSDETKARDAARDEAKDSGLYDRNFFGKSTIDSSKLGEASIEQLEAILHDDDLSEEDKEKVVAALEQKKIEKDKALVDAGLEPTEGTQGEAIETAGAPTGDAVAAGGDALAAAGAAAGQNVTVSNVQQMAGAMGGREKTCLLYTSPSPRDRG